MKVSALTSTHNYFEDFTVGEVLRHARGKTVEPLEQVWITNVTMNTAEGHFNEHLMKSSPWGQRLGFGGVTISMCIGLAAEDTAENALMELGLDKIRLKAAGKLPSVYFTGVEDPTHFDARCTRFLGVNYDALVARTLQGGSDEEILEWCFEHGGHPSDEEISVWNAFLRKRGWRDDASEELAESKTAAGFGDRDDIQTWIDLHDAEEGRTPAFA